MRFRQPFGLAPVLAIVLAGNFVLISAGEPGDPSKPKQSAAETWEQIAAARRALDKAVQADVGSLSPEEICDARKQVATLATKLGDLTTEFLEEYPSDTNLLQVVKHGAYAGAFVGLFVEPDMLNGLIEHVTGIEFESDLAKEIPVLASQVRAIREACESNLVAGVIAALSFRPTNNSVFVTLLDLAQKVKPDAGRSLARALIANSPLPENWMKSAATNILNRRFSVGQPFELKFTGIDGRNVDSRKLRGKVLLINFWATTCPPCLGEIPTLKSHYTQYHEQGFEIVGVSLDDEAKPVLKLVREKGVTWPVMLAVGRYTNRFVAECGVFWTPNNWLVDKKGVVREIGAGSDNLEKKIEILLAESP